MEEAGVGNILQGYFECLRAHHVRVFDGTVMTTGAAANPTATFVALATRKAENIDERLQAGAR